MFPARATGAFQFPRGVEEPLGDFCGFGWSEDENLRGGRDAVPRKRDDALLGPDFDRYFSRSQGPRMGKIRPGC